METTDVANDTSRVEKTTAMKKLSDDDRLEAIEASPNVVGFTEFMFRAKQVQLQEAYKKPIKPDPNGGRYA